MTITVITPWRDHRELEADYWTAIRVANARTIIIDNGSVPPLPNAHRIDRNVGFSRACNIGLDLARTDAVVFLNNDIAACGDWLSPLLELLEPGVLVGAELRNGGHCAVDGTAMPYLDGWCLAGMRDDLLDLGGFDESFAEPSYYGDNDLCLRGRASGMTLRESRNTARLLTHKRNQTAGPGDDPAVRAASEQNRQTYIDRARELLAAA